MYKIFPLFFLVFLLAACSEDDDTSTNANKNLVSAIAYQYSANGTLTGRSENYYQDNKLAQSLFYIGEHLSSKRVFEYGIDNQISQLKIYDMSGNVSGTSNYQYDSLGRLTEIVFTSNDHSHTTMYNHSENNIITRTTTSSTGNVLEQWTYHINSSGKIYKITEGDNIVQEVAYIGNNIAWLTYNSAEPTTINYTYDDENEVKGEYLHTARNLMNNHPHNHIINMGFLSAALGSDKYLIHQVNSDGSNESTFEYNFDAEGYPIEKRDYFEGSTHPRLIINIAYE